MKTHFQSKLCHAGLIVVLLLGMASAKEFTVKDVPDAIIKGRDYLMSQQLPDGTFDGKFAKEVGSTALAVCALRKAGLPRDHEVFKKAMPHIFKYAANTPSPDYKSTYNTGICLLALDAMHTRDADGYSADTKLDNQILAAAQMLAQKLLKGQGPRGGWFYYGKTDGDLSCTQYGGLGLWAAERIGVPPVPRQTWDQLASCVMKVHQEDDGGFTYKDKIKKSEKTTHTMTAAGIGTLALCIRQTTQKPMVRETRADYDPNGKKDKAPPPTVVKKPASEIEKAIERGLTALVRLGVTEKNAYYWYALERACTLTGTLTLDGVDWFEVLYKQILPEQKPNGSWVNGQDATVDTAWAVLALSRATGQMIKKDDYDPNSKSSAAAPKDESKPATPEKKPAETKPKTAETKPKTPEKPKAPAEE